MTTAALDGIRVIDFTSGPAGGLATTVLADFGAEVIKVEPPGGDRFRSQAASPFWLRGKKSVVVNLASDAGKAQAMALAASGDVVMVSGPPSRLQDWGLDSAVRSSLPQLIHCTISGWGTEGPYAELPGYEGLVAAKFGRMEAFEVQLGQGRPVYSAVQVATHVASQAAVQGVLAALVQRERTGHGATVEASLVQALMAFDLVDLLSRQVAEQRGDGFMALRHLIPMPTLNYHPLRTSDGVWIQCGNLLEHLFMSFLDATDLLGELLIEEQFQVPPAQWSAEATEQARDRMLLRMQERTAAEWMAAFEENGSVAAEPIVTSQDALSHLDLVEGNGLVTIEDGQAGTTTQITAIAELTATPAVIDAGAPTPGSDTDAVLACLEPRPVSEPVAAASVGRPLEGVTIVDLSTIIAAPLATTMLADLGARVIKVEPLGGDPFRGLLIEGRMAVKTNSGKESICIDLKRLEGQQILHHMLADADVLVHNFRGEVPAKLGVDWERLHAINPKLISAVVTGYGPHGPGATRPATHPVMGACTGGVAHQAGAALTRECESIDELREAARQIMAANEANPDPNTSAVAASAILLALVARGADGDGQQVRISMQVANAWANGDDFLSYGGKPARPTADADHFGLNAGYRLYPTANGWVFLALTVDAEFQRFCAAANCEHLAGDERFADGPARAANDSALADALTLVFAAQSADEWETQLTAAGVGCVRADGIEVDRFIAEDPHMVANGWAPMVIHQRFGTVRRWGPVVTVDGVNAAYGPAPLAGQHTDNLLTEFGYADQIAELRAGRIVRSE